MSLTVELKMLLLSIALGLVRLSLHLTQPACSAAIAGRQVPGTKYSRR